MITALVTPLNRDQSVDHGALAALVAGQLRAGVDGLAPLGSTGEGGLLEDRERRAVLATVARAAGGRVPILAGTGCQSTWQTCERQSEAAGEGATLGLVVSPFYCRPDAAEQVGHFRRVAAATPLPVVVYEVPKRTGVASLPVAALRELADVKGIVGLKDATGEVGRVAEVRRAAPAWTLLSGDDRTFAAFVAAGGDGVVSVASNLAPKAMVAALAARPAPAATGALAALCDHLAGAANPREIKRLLAARGLAGATLRLPLCQSAPLATPAAAFAGLT